MRRILFALLLVLPLLAVASDNDIDKINGAARVEAGQHAGDVSTVNGAVEIGAGAVVQEAQTVNGAVTLAERAQAAELSTVNGAISLGTGSKVSGDVEATNGSVDLARGADIGGKLSNVNGAIRLDAAHVAGGIETVSGDITVGANSQVEGGILVDKSSSWFGWNGRTPTVVIGPHAVVRGTLEFRRDVVLKVSDSAQIGPVKGATVQKFSGATP
jgi:acyl-[acyl carrier protein]--UDP-N-acetylglucosamine O-acyltransferase